MVILCRLKNIYMQKAGYSPLKRIAIDIPKDATIEPNANVSKIINIVTKKPRSRCFRCLSTKYMIKTPKNCSASGTRIIGTPSNIVPLNPRPSGVKKPNTEAIALAVLLVLASFQHSDCTG
jgi:hypothetical protein